MDGIFRWHPEARALDATGAEVDRQGQFIAVLPDRPSGDVLASALAGQGQAFRIGLDGPDPEGLGGFETLTGGSTGTPRRIRRSQASWIASFAVNARLFGLGPGVRTAVLGRLVHSLALYGALESLHLGAELHLFDALRRDRQRFFLATRRIAHLYATPAQLRLLVDTPGPELPLLRHVVVGGSKLDAGLRAAVSAMAPGVRVHEFYGAAEASFITLTDADTPADSVGRLYPGVDLAVRDAAGRDLAEGETGEVWLRSPYLFDGYAGAPGSARWADGWLTVGEHGRMVGGHLYLAGRAGRMVKIADQAVYPEEIEAFLLARPGITQAAVLPRPDAARGWHLVALVQGGEDDAALLADLRRAFGPLVAPRAVLRPGAWPVLPSGKTDLAALERWL